MGDEVLCHLCCELMPAPGLEHHLATAHGEATADACEEGTADTCGEGTADGGGETTPNADGDELEGMELTTNMAMAAALGKGDTEETIMEGVGMEVSDMDNRASHVQLFWIFMLFQAVYTIKLNFKAGLFSSTFQFEH